jgi:hypothetical protein
MGTWGLVLAEGEKGVASMVPQERLAESEHTHNFDGTAPPQSGVAGSILVGVEAIDGDRGLIPCGHSLRTSWRPISISCRVGGLPTSYSRSRRQRRDGRIYLHVDRRAKGFIDLHRGTPGLCMLMSDGGLCLRLVAAMPTTRRLLLLSTTGCPLRSRWWIPMATSRTACRPSLQGGALRAPPSGCPARSPHVGVVMPLLLALLLWSPTSWRPISISGRVGGWPTSYARLRRHGRDGRIQLPVDVGVVMPLLLALLLMTPLLVWFPLLPLCRRSRCSHRRPTSRWTLHHKSICALRVASLRRSPSATWLAAQ